jgi:hypothetical protein
MLEPNRRHLVPDEVLFVGSIGDQHFAKLATSDILCIQEVRGQAQA